MIPTLLNRTLSRLTLAFRGRVRLVKSHPLRLAVFLLALAPIVGFGYLGKRIAHVINQRIQTFHELEMYEGDMALHAIRLFEGKQLYPSRDGDYIPLLYTPLFTYVNALAMKWFDPPGEPHTIYAGRIVSIWSTIGILLILFAWVYRETSSVAVGLASALFFFSINPLVGWWFDIARVDMLHVLFVAAGSWAFLDRRSGSDRMEIMKGILAGLFFTCGFYTKQTAGQIALGMTFLAFGISPLRAMWGMVAGGTLGGTAWIYFNLVNTDFFYMTVTVPSKHFIDLNNWQARLRQQVYTPAAATLAISAAWTVLAVVRGRWRHVIMAMGLVWTGYFCLRGALTIGGYLNHYLPIWFFLCLCAGVGAGTIMPNGRAASRSWPAWGLIVGVALVLGAVFAVKYKGWHWPVLLAISLVAVGARGRAAASPRGLWPGRVSFVPVVLFAFLALDMAHHTNVRRLYKDPPNGPAWQAYDTKYRIPTELDGARRLIQAIAELDGSVWIPHANYYAYLVGRPTDISTDHVRDVAMAGVQIPTYTLDILNQRKYKYILLNNVNTDHDWQANEVRLAIQANYGVIENWDTKFGWQALKPVDMTGQKPRALLIQKDLMPSYPSTTAP